MTYGWQCSCDMCMGIAEPADESQMIHDILHNSSQVPPREWHGPGQTWVWMNGPGEPHWEIRGTGLVFTDDERARLRKATAALDEAELYRLEDDGG